MICTAEIKHKGRDLLVTWPVEDSDYGISVVKKNLLSRWPDIWATTEYHIADADEADAIKRKVEKILYRGGYFA